RQPQRQRLAALAKPHGQAVVNPGQGIAPAMTLDPKRLARDAKRVQAARPAGGIGRETTGVTPGRAGLRGEQQAGLQRTTQVRHKGRSWRRARQSTTNSDPSRIVPYTPTRIMPTARANP
ncbi:MAG: hypothetical protein ABW003_06205, partial [Microvirga sp.]